MSPFSRSVRVGIIVNRNARRLASDGPLCQVYARAADRGARIYETRSFAELTAAAADIASRGIERVVLAGGDGSYMAGVTALYREMGDPLPVVSFAPGGTVSTVARNWGLRGQTPREAQLAVDAAFNSEHTSRSAAISDGGKLAPIVARPTLRVRDDTGADRIGFIFGAGLVVNFFDVYYASARQGYAGAAAIVARVFAGSFVGGKLAARVLRPTPAALYVDGIRRAPNAWSLVLASVVRDVGLHMHVTYRAAEALDRFHAVASALPPRALGPQMRRVLRGLPLSGDGHVDALASELRVDFTDRRGGPTYVVDGEPLSGQSVRVTAGPTIQVLRASR